MICKRCLSEYNHWRGEDTILHGTCKGLCEMCQGRNYREYQKMYSHRSRTAGTHLPCTLTLPQWIATLDYFGWQCAYCCQRPYTTLEHFMPMILGGGTTASNCIPSCPNCDAVKAKKHPDNVTGIPKEDMQRVREYLMSFEKS